MLSTVSMLSTLARRFAALACVVLVVVLSVRSHEHSRRNLITQSSLVAHEWGTFTSIAGADGSAVEWLPLPTRSDLPSFVETRRNGIGKGGIRGKIRMETPVLYFYSANDVNVAVHVSFSHGLITEWYPHANVQPSDSAATATLGLPTRSGISWNSVLVAPSLTTNFPKEAAASHYYATRATSATPLAIATPLGQQLEKFLFYRGVAAFSPTISAKVLPKGQVQLQNRDAHAVPALILFERYGDKLGYRLLPPLSGSAVVETPSTSGTLDSLRADFEGLLVAQGLYPDEAHAMLETWRDAWFEEGSRLFYIVPRSFVDSVLPLSIQPAPSQVTRVFVGRIELITPATQEAVETALLSRDERILEKYERFLNPILDSITPENLRTPRASQLRNSLSSYLARSISRTSGRPLSTVPPSSSPSRLSLK